MIHFIHFLMTFVMQKGSNVVTANCKNFAVHKDGLEEDPNAFALFLFIY